MFCTNCGQALLDGTNFCPKCGASVKRAGKKENVSESEGMAAENTAEGINKTVVNERTADNTEAVAKPPKAVTAVSQDIVAGKQKPSKSGKKKRNPVIWIAVVLLMLAGLGTAGFFGYRYISVNKAYEACMAEAADYAEAGKYRKSERTYKEALELKPDSKEALLGLADAYIQQEDFEEAMELLQEKPISEEDEHYEAFQTMLVASQLNPQIVSVDTEHFPWVAVRLSCGSTQMITEDMLSLKEDGLQIEPLELTQTEEGLLVEYEAADSDFEPEHRGLAIELSLGDYVFLREGGYETPVFEHAQIQLVSTDVSQYPKVTVYLRVLDANTGEEVENLDMLSFLIKERTSGGEYLSREVHAASTLEGVRGLNINLVADKSDSISEVDMNKIKQVLSQFVGNLHYEEGDKAEILAFDSIVQQMCSYTNDEILLLNGVSNMSPDGMTAFYDAVYDGIHHASLQGGARCVIAFTDGMDNMSLHSYYEVIDYANTNQVPVYIIGVGDYVEEEVLRNLAESTGGRYWFIDDLYDLEEIYNEIYQEQKQLYAVEYISDSALDAYLSRDLDIKVSGAGYKAEVQESFQPVRSLDQGEHTSRYMLVKEALTWEEATERCQEMGGHLATITSEAEMNQLIAMAEAEGVRYIWLGGYTSYDFDGNVFGHWVTGEEFSYQYWSVNEPSRVDLDGTEEWYIMLWNIPGLGGWTWNDQRNDPASVATAMVPEMGFICEFEQ